MSIQSTFEEFIKKTEDSRNISPFRSRLLDSVDKLQKDISNLENVPLNDSYGNKITSTGDDDFIKSFTSYGFSNDTLNYPLWTCLYNDSWIFRRAIDKPAEDMVRSGITLVGDSDFKEVYKDLNGFRNQLINLIKWGALYGGSLAVLMFDNFKDEDYAKNLNIDLIKNSKFIKMYVTDRWYGVNPSLEVDTDMISKDYGTPSYYNITFSDGQVLKVNHCYVLRYEHRNAPNLIKRGVLQGWGYAEGAHIINELARDDQLKSAITSLINKSLIEVIKMAGMRGLFMGTDKTNEEQLRKRLEMVNWARNYNSLTFLDKDDDYSQNEFSGLSGLADLLDANMKLISAALEMPGVLFGDLKDGMGNDVNALERYDQAIQNRNETFFRNILEKLINILFIKYNINEKIDFTFNSLLMQKQANDRVENIKNYQQLLSGLLQDGVIDLATYAKSLNTFSLTGNIDFNFNEDKYRKLEEQENEESEDLKKVVEKDEDGSLF